MRQLMAVLLVAAMPGWALSPKAKRRLTFVAAVAAQFLDVHSSLGRREANPLLRGPDGRFHVGRGVGLKLGILGGMFAAQELRPGREWTWINLGYAGAATGVAIRNYRLRPPAGTLSAPPLGPGAVGVGGCSDCP
jgi:hypothetical protein